MSVGQIWACLVGGSDWKDCSISITFCRPLLCYLFCRPLHTRPDWNAPPGVFRIAQTATLFISSCKARIKVISSISASDSGCPARRPRLDCLSHLGRHRPLPVLQELVHPRLALKHDHAPREIACSVDYTYPPLRFSLNRAIAPRSANSALA